MTHFSPTALMHPDPEGLYVLAEAAEAAVKQARIDALDAAWTACRDETIVEPDCNDDDAYNTAVYECCLAIESLKGKTP